MVISDMRERVGQSYSGRGSAFDLVTSKLRRPRPRPRTVRRSWLVETLAREDSGPIVSVVAPAGYGKTTLLSQWAERGEQAFAWVSVDERDNDPKVLLTYVAKALDAVEPLSGRAFDVLASTASSVPGAVMPRLGSAFAAMATPVVLVLDDVHLLHTRECRSALSVLADHVPSGSRLVLTGRTEPPVRIARLRAEGRILEIGRADLSLTREKAARLLREAEVTLGEDDVAELHRRTEGWAVGLYLAALALQEGGSLDSAAASFTGDDRLVSEYVESEFLPAGRSRPWSSLPIHWQRAFSSRCPACPIPPLASVRQYWPLAWSDWLLASICRAGDGNEAIRSVGVSATSRLPS